MCEVFAETLFNELKENYTWVLGDKTGTYIPQFTINDWMPYKLMPERIDEKTYSFTYPKEGEENSFLRMPIKKDYIKLNLEDPYKMSKIIIESDNIEKIDIYINCINNKLGYDDQEMILLNKNEDMYSWNVDPSLEITSINIAAKIKDGKEQKMIIKVE